MRKFIVKLASMILIFAMCITSLFGCGLVTTDSERDMNQVIATIQIDGAAKADTVKKKDLVTAYLNYGYIYEQQYGYSTEDTFEIIVDTLVNNRILVQSVIKAQYDQTKGWEVENYLSDDAKLEAKYTAIKAMNDLLENYKAQVDDDKIDSIWTAVRAVPTNAANKEDDVNKEEYVAKGVVMEETADFRKAYNKVIDLLRVNELLGDGYKVNDITTTDYYQQILKDAQENQLIVAYQKVIKNAVIDKFVKDSNGVTLTQLEQAYKDKIDEQKELSTTELAEKFASATASDPILVGTNGKYGYVYNLLLGVDSVLSSEISNIKAENENMTSKQYAEARRAILEATVVKDLRTSWISAGYDFDGTKFTGDYTFAIDANNSLPFKGTAQPYDAEDLDKGYKVTSVEEYNLTKFIDLMEKYVYGDGTTITATLANQTDATNPSEYKRINCQDDITEYDNKINELLFAFSTDSGSLNTYKGYVIKPLPEGSETEEYMQEFADGARELINIGGSSYIIVATDYGYHVMFFSEVLNANYGFDTLTEYLDSLYGAKDWTEELEKMLEDWDEYDDKENYLYLLANSLFSTQAQNAVNKFQRDSLNSYRYAENGGVTIYEDRYADLLA